MNITIDTHTSSSLELQLTSLFLIQLARAQIEPEALMADIGESAMRYQNAATSAAGSAAAAGGPSGEAASNPAGTETAAAKPGRKKSTPAAGGSDEKPKDNAVTGATKDQVRDALQKLVDAAKGNMDAGMAALKQFNDADGKPCEMIKSLPEKSYADFIAYCDKQVKQLAMLGD